MESLLNSEKPWPMLQKVGFRFVFIFFILLIVFENNGAFPFFYFIDQPPTELAHQFIPWVGKHVLRLSYDITVFRNGSGDTTYDYVLVFTSFSIAFFGMILWSVIDRNKPDYRVLFYWLTVAVRFYVALMLINYGMAKVFKTQFPSPGLYRLSQPYGNSSPMGLAWTFLGFSEGYNFFMGFAEFAAALLLFRRTVAAGAIITLMTTANVMAVNYFYDVPVKILSTTLFVMTLFLLLPHLRRLIKFFFSGEPVSLPAMPLPEFKRKGIYTIGTVLKFIALGCILIFSAYGGMQTKKIYGDSVPKNRFYGIYNVETFVLHGDTIPPLTTDNTRWRQLTIEWETFARVRFMTDRIDGYTMSADTTLNTIQFQGLGQFGTFNYTFNDPTHFLLTGTINDVPASILFTVNKDVKSFNLTGRGFHWINEYPHNR
jgi:hypothetical protein